MEVQALLPERIGKDIFMYSISLDSEVDTPETLAEYAESYGIGPGWTFLTGRKEDIEALRHRLGAFDPDPVIDADKTQHAGILVCGNEAKGRWCGLPGQMPARTLARYMTRVLDL